MTEVMVLTGLLSQDLQVLSVSTVTCHTPKVGRTGRVVLALSSFPDMSIVLIIIRTDPS